MKLWKVKVSGTFDAFECVEADELPKGIRIHDELPAVSVAYTNQYNQDGSLQHRGWAEIYCRAKSGNEAIKIAEAKWDSRQDKNKVHILTSGQDDYGCYTARAAFSADYLADQAQKLYGGDIVQLSIDELVPKMEAGLKPFLVQFHGNYRSDDGVLKASIISLEEFQEWSVGSRDQNPFDRMETDLSLRKLVVYTYVWAQSSKEAISNVKCHILDNDAFCKKWNESIEKQRSEVITFIENVKKEHERLKPRIITTNTKLDFEVNVVRDPA